MSASRSLTKIVARLAKFYGRPKPPVAADPFELILWDNVAYLVSDERRAQAFELLRQSVGTKPHEILAARPEALLKVALLIANSLALIIPSAATTALSKVNTTCVGPPVRGSIVALPLRSRTSGKSK